MLWWITASAGTPCEQPSSSVGIQAAIDDAIRSSTGGTIPDLIRPRRAIHCLGELVHPDVAAAWLRLEGVAASRAGDPARATTYFQSAWTVPTALPIDPLLAPAGSPEADLHARSATIPAETWTPPPDARLVFVNGAFATTVPNGLAIVQTIGSDNSIAWTRMATGPADFGPPPAPPVAPPAPIAPIAPAPLAVAPPRAVLPPSPTAPVALPAPAVPPPRRPALPQAPRATPSRGSAALTLLGAGILAGGAAALTGAAISRSRYSKAPTRARRLRTNGLAGAAVGLGVVGAGITFTGLILPRGDKAGRPSKYDETEGLY